MRNLSMRLAASKRVDLVNLYRDNVLIALNNTPYASVHEAPLADCTPAGLYSKLDHLLSKEEVKV